MEDGRGKTHKLTASPKSKTSPCIAPLATTSLLSYNPGAMICKIKKKNKTKQFRVITQSQPLQGGITHHGHGHPQCSVQIGEHLCTEQRKAVSEGLISILYQAHCGPSCLETHSPAATKYQ